ncbi:MAG TPA: hypothetical protein VFF70_14530 [Anaerolineae bacterium]|nr:hypothetical protein [Anaerolineae bacterium]
MSGQCAGQHIANVYTVDPIDLCILDRGQHRIDCEEVDRLVPPIADRDLPDPNEAYIAHSIPLEISS